MKGKAAFKMSFAIWNEEQTLSPDPRSFFILLADQFPVGDEKENAKLDGNLKLLVG